MSNTIETIGGFPIIATFEFPKRGATRPGRVILVQRGLDDYVAATQFSEGYAEDLTKRDTEWHQGAYCYDLGKAFGRFISKVEQYAGVTASIPLA